MNLLVGHRAWAVSCLVLGLGCAWAQGGTSTDSRVPMVDVHTHFQSGGLNQNFSAALQTALSKMDELGIRQTVLMPPPLVGETPNYYDIEHLRFAADKHPGRVAIMGGSSLNVMIHNTPAAEVTDAVKARFKARFDAIVAQGAVGIGEMGIHHVSIPAMGSQHAYESVPADHPLYLLLADLAAERAL